MEIDKSEKEDSCASDRVSDHDRHFILCHQVGKEPRTALDLGRSLRKELLLWGARKGGPIPLGVGRLLGDHLVLSDGPLSVRGHAYRLLKQLEEVDYLVQVRLLDSRCLGPSFMPFLRALWRFFRRTPTRIRRKRQALL